MTTIDQSREAACKALRAFTDNPNTETSTKAQEALDRFVETLGEPMETWKAIREVMG